MYEIRPEKREIPALFRHNKDPKISLATITSRNEPGKREIIRHAIAPLPRPHLYEQVGCELEQVDVALSGEVVPLGGAVAAGVLAVPAEPLLGRVPVLQLLERVEVQARQTLRQLQLVARDVLPQTVQQPRVVRGAPLPRVLHDLAQVLDGDLVRGGHGQDAVDERLGADPEPQRPLRADLDHVRHAGTWRPQRVSAVSAA